MEEITNKLADYILVLSEALEKDNYANNRPMYTKHLAAGAVMLALLQKNKNLAEIVDLVKQENRNYGWSYIKGPYGEIIGTAWEEFLNTANIGDEKT
jgi:hypothetical protein